jgi:hypothetical protein
VCCEPGVGGALVSTRSSVRSKRGQPSLSGRERCPRVRPIREGVDEGPDETEGGTLPDEGIFHHHPLATGVRSLACDNMGY